MLNVLLLQNSIELAFRVVLDLKESDIIESLQVIISQHRDAMQIDSSSNTIVISLPAQSLAPHLADLSYLLCVHSYEILRSDNFVGNTG